MVELLNIDCLEYMATLPDKAFDLAIVDPPYGIGAGNGSRAINRNKTWDGARDRGNIIKGDWDKEIPSDEYFAELFRVSENQIIWGGNYFNLPLNNNWIIWDKKVSNHTFSPFEMAWSSNGKCKIFRWLMEGYKSERPLEMQNKFHPTQKPIDLYKWLLKNYATPDMKIIDTHGGSMSSVIACIDGGFDMVCCEIDKDYFTAGVNRVKSHILQLDMFIRRPEIIISK